MVEFKDFSRPLGDFPVIFKADLIFKYFSRKPSFQACANPESSNLAVLFKETLETLEILLICSSVCWVIFHDFFLSADCFSKLTFSKNHLRN